MIVASSAKNNILIVAVNICFHNYSKLSRTVDYNCYLI
nr:MAG TPA: hypothetical protein [Caudoviricetes sp.]